jgi:hypothetical protein
MTMTLSGRALILNMDNKNFKNIDISPEMTDILNKLYELVKKEFCSKNESYKFIVEINVDKDNSNYEEVKKISYAPEKSKLKINKKKLWTTIIFVLGGIVGIAIEAIKFYIN